MDLRTLVIIVVVLAVLVWLFSSRERSEEFDLVEMQIRHTVRECGYVDKFRLNNHRSKSFTRAKKDVFLCSSCVLDDDEEYDELVYVGLHEAAHALSKTKHHTEEWKRIMKELMYKASDLGYLEKDKILI